MTCLLLLMYYVSLHLSFLIFLMTATNIGVGLSEMRSRSMMWLSYANIQYIVVQHLGI